VRFKPQFGIRRNRQKQLSMRHFCSKTASSATAKHCKLFISIRKTRSSANPPAAHSFSEVLFLPQSPGFHGVGLFIFGGQLQQ
jgi:hypothetical protein